VAAPERLIPLTAWLKVAVAFGLAALVATWLPGASGDGATPPLADLVVSGALIAALTTGALFVVLRFDLGLPAAAVFYAVAFNLLIVLVKFVWGPAGLYQVNVDLERNLSSQLGDPALAAFAAGFVLALYVAVYLIVYRFTKSRLERQLGMPPPGRRVSAAWLLLPILFVVFAITTGGGLIVLLIPLLFGAGGIEYMQFVFSSGYSLAIALALVGATSLAALAFKEVGERARLIGDVGVLVAFFWVGLAFLVIYHVVWAIYIVALTALWPLRVVVPK
jgi:hypothetical protein